MDHYMKILSLNFFLLLIIAFSLVGILNANAGTVPDWVKNNAGWWATDKISENEFLNAIEFLINNGIINIEMQMSIESQLEEFFEKTVLNIPTDKMNTEFNSQGFRGPEFEIKKPNDIYRIIAVGGSTTFGSGVEENFTWPAILQKSLNDLQPTKRIEVINAGIGAASSFNNSILIKDRLTNYNPDLIIIYEGGNDIACMQNEFHNADTKWDSEAKSDECGEGYELINYPDYLAERYSKTCEIGNKNDFDVVVILQPVIELNGKILTFDEVNSYFDRGNHRIMLDDYNLMKSGVLEKTEGCKNIVDFSDLFHDFDIPLFFDYIHVANLGNTIIAENILDTTLPILTEKNILSAKSNNLEKTKKFNYNLGKDFTKSNFSGQNLENESYFGANLAGSDFSNAVLTNTDFRLANLQNVNFANANLDNIKLQQNVLDYANFRNVDFTNVNLENVDLSYTNLIGADFSGNEDENKDLTRTFFYNSDLSYANMSYTVLNNMFFINTNLEGVNLYNADLTDSVLQHIKNRSLVGANVTSTSFSYTDLRGLDVSGLDFSDTNFKGANLSGLDLTDNIFFANIFYSADLSNVNLSGADLSPKKRVYELVFPISDFSNLDGESVKSRLLSESATGFPISHQVIGNDVRVLFFQFTHFGFANLSGADLSDANLSITILSDADLSGADLTNADLSGADLTNTNLSDADLSGADLTNTNLSNANLSGAIFSVNTIMNCINHPVCINE